MTVRTLVVEGAIALLRDGPAEGTTIVAHDGRITEIRRGRSGAAENVPGEVTRVDGEGLIVSPGLIDVQINGGFGEDFTSDPASMWTVGAHLTRVGVTAFLPTLVSALPEEIDRARAVVEEGPPAGYRGAVPLGLHVEGPFISPERRGTHPPERLRAPDPGMAEAWSPDNGVRMVTLAPELPGALPLVEALTGSGVVVSAGHSAATADEARKGFDAGIRYATHLFNAMAPISSREPSLPGAAIDDARVTVGVITDGYHVHPSLVRIAHRAVGVGRFSAVTDATAAWGREPGAYRLGGRIVTLADGAVRDEEGRLAGSALAPDEAIRRLRDMAALDAWRAVAAMTSVPASLLGMAADRGVLAVGGRADLVLFDASLRPVATFIDGTRVYPS